MRSAWLDDADPSAVSHAVRDVLEERGALVTEHVSTRIRFVQQATDSTWSWTRSGYVGISQRYGEPQMLVRLALRARWPHRLFWLVALVNVIVALLTFVVNPSGTAWFLLGVVTGLALLVSGIVYVNTWRHVRAEEESLMDALEHAFATRHIASALVDEDAHRRLSDEAELEGEVARRRFRAQAAREPAPARKRLPRPAFTFGRKAPAAPAADADEESPDERRARLLRRKAELEAQREREP